ncbi:hypothetical protein ASPCAL07402 [Aspergillus calidoustus]|uniref:Uncharacterized protein n=1 Tax=Aspergillus calidoustus TaxID=454130 RepID=A0A0U5G7L0_ASPCI|nr:hypothetical protein ASPCAL07402 [Aspergillus calidoustus]
MAEALGVAASAISILTLTAQIIDSIDKLRALHIFVKTASIEFEDLLAEIEIIQAVLRTLTPEMLALLNLPSAERRLQVFHQDLETLILKVSKYRSTADRKLGAVKLVLKRETFRTQRQNLDNLKSTLSLLQLACYHASVSQASRKSLTDDTTARSHAEDSNGCRQVARKLDGEKQPKRWYRNEYRFRTPLYFMDKMWTIRTTELYGWKFTLQANNVIPCDSPVFRHCQRGEVEEVKMLFSSGSGSPFDCTPDGITLLHVASRRGQVDMCRFLLENGANRNCRTQKGLSPLHYANAYLIVTHVPPEDSVWIYDFYRLFLQEAEEILFEDYTADDFPLFSFSAPPDTLSLIQSHSFDNYSALPLEIRFRRAMALNTVLHCNLSPQVVQLAMGGSPIDQASYLLEDVNGETLLHKITQAMGATLSIDGPTGVVPWLPLLSDALSAQADLHKISRSYRIHKTPLLGFIMTYTWGRTYVYELQVWSLASALQLWASMMRDTGVDLETYGRTEDYLLHSQITECWIPVAMLHTHETLDSPFGSSDLMCPALARIIGLNYGPEPEDWHLWVTNPIDELVGEFWEMVERSLEVMPGTWID